MSALRGKTASLLLDRVPQQDRAYVVREVAASLTSESSSADVGLAAALLQLHSDAEAKTKLLAHLQSLIDGNDHDQVVLFCKEHPKFEQEVLTQSVASIAAATRAFRDASGQWLAVSCPGSGGQRLANGYAGDTDENMLAVLEQTIHVLHFVNRLLSPGLSDTDARSLSESCLVLIGAAERRLCTAAQEVISSILALHRPLPISQQEQYWQRIQSLVASTDVFYKSSGFALWLRWIFSGQGIDSSILRQSYYWDLIVSGLRHGDSERRKCSLQILRASVDAAVADHSMLTLIARPTESPQSRDAVRKQYTRYCTVFQTIVLGRYLNQVQECEADLDFLSSSQSIVKPIWLHTLLAASLDPKLQESNRKFMGSWIMRSAIRSDDQADFLSFFRHGFIPWATSGSLFTASLRRHHGVMRCEHGDRLSTYISHLLQSDSDLASGIIDSILDSILGRYGNNFAYALVYLMEGIGHACQSRSSFSIAPGQLEKIGRIATWAGFPEVARDYILARSWKLCHDYIVKHPDSSCGEHVASAAAMWKALGEKANRLSPNATAHTHGNISALALEPSRRDMFELKAVTKCVELVKTLENASMTDTVDLQEVVDDIWSDLDYLEYPKGLLAVLPSIMPNHRLIQAALDRSTDQSALAEMIASKTAELAALAVNRSYLLAPLVTAVRQVTATRPASASLLRLEEFIINIAENPPTPTLDAQLEEATVPLLQSMGPGMEVFDYEYYFGPRECVGFAAMLDLVSRLSSTDSKIAHRVLEQLLSNWGNQKIPPPTVSPWKKTLQLQVMLLCSEQYVPGATTSKVNEVLQKLNHILAVEPLPRYRYLLEWMTARVYVHHPELRYSIFEELRTKDHHSNPKFLASLMKVGGTIARLDSSDEAFAQRLATVFVPLAASSKVVIRHEAQWQIPVLMDHARGQNWTSVSENTAYVELDDFIRSLPRFGDPPLERLIDKLDPIQDHTLTHLVEGPWHDLDDVEKRQTTRADFLHLYAQDNELNTVLPPSCMALGDAVPSRLESTEPPPAADVPDPSRKILQNIDNISRALGAGPVAPTALQTKGVAYLESARTRHDNLLVIASLVDNPHNLGGLSRASEIFGAGALYLSTPTVTSSKDFTAVSVSSHLHLPIMPLAPAGLPAFLATKKSVSGFAVVGIEQTDRSVLLGSADCALPEKCILVLGSEREGIPAGVLAACDVLIEIPQVGVTRSLNVQTAAGIVLCEYARQYRR